MRKRGKGRGEKSVGQNCDMASCTAPAYRLVPVSVMWPINSVENNSQNEPKKRKKRRNKPKATTAWAATMAINVTLRLGNR